MFRFTLRELLLLMLVAGLAAGWWSARRELAAERAFRSKLVEVKWRGYGWPDAERVWIEPAPPLEREW